MAETAVSFVLEKLYQLAREEVSLLRGLGSDFSEIKDELESIKAFLKDADRSARAEGGETGEGIKTWVKQLREASFDIEDVIDEYIMYEAHNQKIVHVFKKLKSRHRIASKIQDLKSSLQRIIERRKRYKLQSVEDGSSSSNTTRENDVKYSRMAAQYIEKNEVVGFESPRDELIDYLTKGTNERSLISVVGMGGLGKTTLAKHVFDNKQVKAHFCRSFITVSQSYTVKELLLDMMKKFCNDANETPPKGLDKMDENTLIAEVKQYLQSKKYLVLFDDVWKESFSDEIQLALPNNNKGGRIIITTRMMQVADYCKKTFPVHHIHKLQHLTENKAWELFCKKAFRSEQCPTDLEDMSKQIVQKCGGLPLAIVAIGGLLSTKEKIMEEWRKVIENLRMELRRNAHLTPLEKILSLSYDDLPYNLKSCMLHFGMYPEDYSINRKR